MSTRIPIAACAATLLLLGAGCRQDMHDQPRYEPLEASDFFPDGRSARPLVEGTVARGHLQEDVLLQTGRIGAEFSDRFPFPIDRQVLDRGRERYGIFCAPCHGALGDGRGMAVRRGMSEPPSYLDERLLAEKPGYYFDVITRGFGRMKDYSAQVPPRDRWAIVAYIRALQLSQGARLSDLPERDRAEIEAGEEGS